MYHQTKQTYLYNRKYTHCSMDKQYIEGLQKWKNNQIGLFPW